MAVCANDSMLLGDRMIVLTLDVGRHEAFCDVRCLSAWAVKEAYPTPRRPAHSDEEDDVARDDAWLGEQIDHLIKVRDVESVVESLGEVEGVSKKLLGILDQDEMLEFIGDKAIEEYMQDNDLATCPLYHPLCELLR